MSSKDHRVLGRMGAHELTPEDLERVNGSRLSTVATLIFTGPIYNPDGSLDS